MNRRGLVIGLIIVAAGLWAPARLLSQSTRPAVDDPARRQADQRPRPAATRPATAPARVERARNPHWRADGCRACHASERGEAIHPDDVNRICWECHDGRRAHQEVHPVGRRFTEDTAQPAGWPAPNNELSCITCHEFTPVHRTAERRPQANPEFLREYRGASLTAWCAKCHATNEAHQRFNPHQMIAADGQPDRRACLFCHHTIPGLGNVVERRGRPALQADVIALCSRCHTRHLDYFEPGHIGMTVTPQVKQQMLAQDAAALGTPAAETRRLPLDGGQRVVCSTCHNPHQNGLFPEGSVLEFGGIEPGRPGRRLELRGLGKEICSGCHNK